MIGTPFVYTFGDIQRGHEFRPWEIETDRKPPGKPIVFGHLLQNPLHPVFSELREKETKGKRKGTEPFFITSVLLLLL